jgi:tetratricopeptide (TPR) repeat protein
MHGAGIVHRDIKPNNIILQGSGAEVRLYITDFGLARSYEPEITVTGKGAIAGTPAYMAPELHLGQPPSRATDLFAFGMLLHEVFTGEKPQTSRGNSSVRVSPQLFSAGLPTFCTSLVTECLDRDPQQRCKAFESALTRLEPKSGIRAAADSNGSRWTRRRFAEVAAAAVCVAAGGAWWERDHVDNLLHPLPGKRFVALLSWPNTSDLRLTPMLTGVLSAVKSELARLEAFDRNFFVISPEDANVDVNRVTHLREICAPLGANLVLAASGLSGSDHFELALRLLDPPSGRALREKTLTSPARDLTSLPGRAVRAAASILDLDRYFEKAQQTEPGTQSADAFTAFQLAESFLRKPNDVGLDAAIEKFREAVELDPHYALAFAKLAETYIHLYGLRRDPGALDLAAANCDRALELDPNLVEGCLARALLLREKGRPEEAMVAFQKTLALDPLNTDTLLAQAQLYIRLNRWADAERNYQRVIRQRPNFWVTYNDLGYALDQQGKYQQAIEAFHTATAAAPGSAMAFANLGGEYLETGDFAEATDSLRKSLALQPNDLAAATTSLALRYQGRYDEALPFALKAVALNPGEDTNWLELGDCYSSLRNRSEDAKAAYLRAAKAAEQHLQTDARHGPSWMLLALYRVKSGTPQNALSLIHKAESLGANDMDSQLYKARILELIGKRDEALATLALCFQKGATALQVAPFPDLQSLRRDPRYLRMVQSGSAAAAKGQ